VTEDHLLGFDAADGVEFLEDGQALPLIPHHFKQNDAIGGKVLGDVMQPETGLDVGAILGENLLDDTGVFDPVRDVYANNDVIMLFHATSLEVDSFYHNGGGEGEDKDRGSSKNKFEKGT
jgi:hypothetical protein